jgi:benzaldehyde dehydrogenase (NAD)
MTLMDEPAWRGKVRSGGWIGGDGGDAPVTEPATGQEIGRTGSSGTGARDGGSANLEAFTGTRWWPSAATSPLTPADR